MTQPSTGSGVCCEPGKLLARPCKVLVEEQARIAVIIFPFSWAP